MKRIIPNLGTAVLLVLFTAGCLSDSLKNIDGIIAEPELALPIGKVSFGFKEFIEDDTVFSVTTDGLAQVIYREDSIASLTTTDLISDFTGLWSFDFSEEKEIGRIEIEDIKNSGFYSLRAVVNEMSDPTIQQLFHTNNGSSVPLPAFDEPVNFDIGMPPFANFKNIEIDSGSLILSVNNGFSFGMEDVIFEIYDNVTGTFIDKFNKNTIAPGEQFDLSIDLAGKTINNEFFIKLPRFKSPGSATAVLIDLEQRMSVSVSTSGLKINKGEIEVPTITLPVLDEIIDIDVDNSVQLREANISDGELTYSITSEILIPIEVRVEIPTLSKGGMPFAETISLNTGSTSGKFNLSGYNANFESDVNQPYNRLPAKLEVYTPGSGNVLTAFEKTDKISADFQLIDMAMLNFVGNAGSYTEELDSTELDFDIDFSFLDSETKQLFLENPKIEVFYENSFGVPLEANIEAFATGHFGSVKNLVAPKFVMDYPPASQVGSSVSGTYSINSTNSNIAEVLSIFPEKIKYFGEINVNPASNPSTDNHVSLDSRLTVGLNLELPLRFKTESLVFRDTISDEPISDEDPEEIESLVLVLDYKNDMPFTTTIDLFGIDGAGNESVILEEISVESAGLDAAGRPNTTKEGRIEVELSKTQIDAALNAEELVIAVNMKTGMDGQTHVGIYTTDGIEVGLAARIQLKIEE